VSTVLLSITPVSFAPNDWIRLKRIDGTLIAQTSTDGIAWTELGSVADATYNTGYLGLLASGGTSGNPVTVDYFGGGNLP
jgi:hypothetical protein